MEEDALKIDFVKENTMTLAWCYLRAVKGVFISPWLFQENYVKCFGNARVINEMNANSNFQRIQSEKDIDEFRRRLSNQRKKNVSHIWFADYMIQTILYNHRQPFVIGICIPITHLCLTVDKGWTFRDFGARSRYLAGIINCIPQNTVGRNYFSLPEIPASDAKVFISPVYF